MEQRERIRHAVDRFKDYSPVVDIKYHDESGRQLNEKEAFRQLSHKFHGIKGGKASREKNIRKAEEEMKVLQSKSGDTPLGVAEALARRTRESGSAHVVLSVGKKGAPVVEMQNLSAIPLVKEAPVRSAPVPAREVIDATGIAGEGERQKVVFGFAKR